MNHTKSPLAEPLKLPMIPDNNAMKKAGDGFSRRVWNSAVILVVTKKIVIEFRKTEPFINTSHGLSPNMSSDAGIHRAVDLKVGPNVLMTICINKNSVSKRNIQLRYISATMLKWVMNPSASMTIFPKNKQCPLCSPKKNCGESLPLYQSLNPLTKTKSSTTGTFTPYAFM